VSDVYAMGGKPLVGLNIAAWPRDALPMELLADVLRGGRDIAERGNFLIVGGHTIDDPEPKYGLVVVGRADADHLMTIDAAEAGDVLVLTKPIGTGVVTTALKAEAAPAEVVDAAVASMTRLSDVASAAFVALGVRACTDVTGFGLLGHLHRMLLASGVSAEIDSASVPILPGARELAEAGHVPGGTKRNVEAVDPFVDWKADDETTRVLLHDAQTSGGLLAAVPEEHLDRALTAIDGELARAVVGRVVAGDPGRIVVA
jgi:selenide,water dikinase